MDDTKSCEFDAFLGSSSRSTTTTTRHVSVTFPNLILIHCNVDNFAPASMIDLKIYKDSFAVVVDEIIRTLARPASIEQGVGSSIIRVKLEDGFELVFDGGLFVRSIKKELHKLLLR